MKKSTKKEPAWLVLLQVFKPEANPSKEVPGMGADPVDSTVDSTQANGFFLMFSPNKLAEDYLAAFP